MPIGRKRRLAWEQLYWLRSDNPRLSIAKSFSAYVYNALVKTNVEVHAIEVVGLNLEVGKIEGYERNMGVNMEPCGTHEEVFKLELLVISSIKIMN